MPCVAVGSDGAVGKLALFNGDTISPTRPISVRSAVKRQLVFFTERLNPTTERTLQLPLSITPRSIMAKRIIEASTIAFWDWILFSLFMVFNPSESHISYRHALFLPPIVELLALVRSLVSLIANTCFCFSSLR